MCVVGYLPRPVHAPHSAMAMQRSTVFVGRVFNAAIGMEDQPRRRRALAQGIPQGGAGQIGIMTPANTPAEHRA